MKILIAVTLSCIATLAIADPGWRYYGNDAGGSRYSPASQVSATNVTDLEIAWKFRTGQLGKEFKQGDRLTFEATPVLFERALYFSTAFGEVFAVDAGSGKQIWKFDSELPKDMRSGEVSSRGVTIWQDSAAKKDQVCAVRVFFGNIMGQLYALDARTGLPCQEFADQGRIDLRQGVRLKWQGRYNNYTITSPPVVAGNYLITGSAIGDNGAVDLERGIVRMFDARSGELRWSWDPIPTDHADPAYATWTEGRELAGGANAWPPLSVDVDNGLVFVPTGSPSPDFYGGLRPGNGEYANSVVALAIETGQVVWHRQLVHHDLWDYDLPAQPVLIDLRKDGKTIPALVQATKMGMLFVFNRLTGEAVYPIEERAVPQSAVAGERPSPTQPFSSLPLLSSHAPVTADDAWGFYFSRKACAKRLGAMRSEGIYTPPSLEGTVTNPGFVGGSNWGGLAYDPGSQIVVATVMEAPTWVRLTPQEKLAQLRESDDFDWEGYTEMEGAPYFLTRGMLLSPLGIPCTAPPWGKLVAMDLGKGEIVWNVPLGTIEDVAPALVPNLKLGVPGMGGAIVTGAGLVFVAAAADDYLRAFALQSGEELWKGRLPAGGQATPMTYELDGKQYVVIAAGGHGGMGTTRGDYVVAFALKD